MLGTLNEDEPMASDKIDEIRTWLDSVKEALDNEEISYGELIEIDRVYDILF